MILHVVNYVVIFVDSQQESDRVKWVLYYLETGVLAMELKDKNVLIFAAPNFEDRELFYPLYRFQEAGATVKVAGIGEKNYQGKFGVPVQVDGQTQDFVNQKWDIVVVPGGWAPDKIRMNQPALEIVRKTLQAGNIVAAICHGGWVLASAGVVKGKTVTSYPAIKDDLINAGAKWVDREVVEDGGIITSRTPDDLPAFCKEIIRVASTAKAAV
jgi:protease I